MTLLRDLAAADQQVPINSVFFKVPSLPFTRPHLLSFNEPASPPPQYLSPLSDCSLSPEILMGESMLPQDFTIKTEPLDIDNCADNFTVTPPVSNSQYHHLNGNTCSLPSNTEFLTSGSANNNNNNNPGDATPTENAMSLIELDQLLNSELTFYDELRLSGVVKQEVVQMAQREQQPAENHADMDYDSDSDSDSSAVICSESFQVVQSEIVRQVKNDIRQARSMLDLPSDPKLWSPENVQNWILWTLKHYNLGIVENLDNFRMNGREFLAMSEADFKARSPLLGPAIFAQLDMWQNASSLDEPTPTSSPAKPRLPQANATFMPTEQRRANSYLQLSPTSENIPVPTSSTDPLSPDPLSPTDSSLDSTSFGSSVSSCGSDDESETGGSGRQSIQLWQFLKMLLLQPQFYGNCIRWIDRDNGIFKIEDSQRVAKLWGKRKNRPAMNYDKLSRSIRQYYKKGIIKKTENSKRLVYRFCHPYML